MLSREEARAFYDRFGARQDRQGLYEDAALAELVAHGDFEEARAVVEVGCGTGRFAWRLLAEHLVVATTYRGFDLSATMAGLAAARLAPFGERARVEMIEGAPPLPCAQAGADRVVSNYVMDLLPQDEVVAWLAEARRVLAPGGRLCVTGLTPGVTPLARVVSALWAGLHAVAPRRVGGCRPLCVRDLLPSGEWEVRHHGVVAAWGIASEVLVAVPLRTR